MNTRITFKFIFIVVLLSSCKRHHEEKEIEAAMNQYNHLILRMDVDSLSQLFAVDGNLGTTHGRQNIRNLFASFTNVRVLSQATTTTSIVLKGDTAIHDGSYLQKAVINAKDTIESKGTFETTWQWIPGEGWRIKRMMTLAE